MRQFFTGVRPYKCDYCPMAFTQKNNLTRHMKVHGPQFLFKCPFELCEYETRRRETVKPHMMTHGAIHFQCRMCRREQAFFYQEVILRLLQFYSL